MPSSYHRNKKHSWKQASPKTYTPEKRVFAAVAFNYSLLQALGVDQAKSLHNA